MTSLGTAMQAGAATPPRRAARLLAAGYFALLLLQASIAPLQEPDEGRSASIAWEMMARGDWLTPRLNGICYYEKPPLFFWCAAAAMAVLGPVELAPRIPSVLASFLTVLVVAHWGRSFGRPGAGGLAGAALASMLLFALIARVALVDPLLTLAIAASLYCADRFLLDRPPAEATPGRYRLGFWGALALAVLAKGPVGIVIPLASVAVFSLATRDWRSLGSLLRPDGILLFAVIAAPWFVAMSRRNPDYPAEFLLGQNLDRFIEGSRFNRDKPFWYYLPVLLIGFLPWSLLLPGIVADVREAWKDRRGPESRRRLFLASAVLVPFLLLSIAHSKLLHYLLPICPPFALLAAETLTRAWARKEDSAVRAAFCRPQLLSFGALIAAFALVLCVPAALAPEVIARRLGFEPAAPGYDSDLAKIRRFRTPLSGAALILGGVGASAFGAAALLRRHRAPAALLVLTAALLGAVTLVQFLVEPMGPVISARALAEKTARHLAGDTPVVLYRRHLRGMTFYLRRRIVLFDAPYNEFGHDVSESDPYSFAGRPEALGAFLERNPAAVFVAEGPQRLRELEGYTARSFEVLDRESEFLIVRARRR
jgi:4-amino-4-deoxy-L-arabinose transferase-like glycosyltransferase